MKTQTEIKLEKEIKEFGQKEAKRILGDNLPNSFMNQFLEGKSLFTSIIKKTIELTNKADIKAVEDLINSIPRSLQGRNNRHYVLEELKEGLKKI